MMAGAVQFERPVTGAAPEPHHPAGHLIQPRVVEAPGVTEPRTQHRPGLLVLRFALLNLVAFGLLGAAWVQGLVGLVTAADKTRICLVIFAVFAAGFGMCVRLVWRVSRELDAARSEDLYNAPALEELLDPVRRCGTDQRASLVGALRLRLSQRISVIRQIASNLVLLGLIGTVVGFIIALSGVDPSRAGDVSTMAPMVARLIEGMSTALYTTLVGSILNIWLMASYQVLAGGTVQLIASLTENIETHARPRLYR